MKTRERFFKDQVLPSENEDGLIVVATDIRDGVGFLIRDYRDPHGNNYARLSRKQVLQLIAYLQKVTGETPTKRRGNSRLRRKTRSK